MKTKIITFFIIAAAANLYAEAFFSGGVNSVNPDSGFNALRNPALMSSQDKDSAGFSCMYLSDIDRDISAEFDSVMLTDAKIEAESDEKYNGTISFSYVNRFSGGAFGFGIRKPEGTDQFAKSEGSFTMTGSYEPLSIAIKNETKEEKKSFAVSSVFSLSKDFGRNESAGIQFEAGISDSTSEKEKSGYGFAVEDYNMEISTKKFIGNLNCGYHYTRGNYEIGAVIKFGEYIYEKQDYEYEDNLTTAQASDEISSYLYQNKGLEYTIGFGYNITSSLLFNMEMNIGLPFDQEIKKLKDDDNGLMAEENSTTHVNYTNGIAAGFDYKYSSNLKFGFGGGAVFFNADSAGSDRIKTGDFNYNAYSVVTGLEVRPAEDLILLFGVNIYSVDMNQNYESVSQSQSIEIQTLYLNVIAGASMFY